MQSTNPLLDRFRHALRFVSVDAALAILNAGVAHRYTGVFELRGDVLVMRYVFDKQVTADIQFLNVIPLEDSFCQIVLREDGFRSDNTRIDPRLNYSPYKGVVMAYHGVPMHSDNRIHSGTLCHFDVVDRQLGDADYQLLRQAAHMLPAYVLGRI